MRILDTDTDVEVLRGNPRVRARQDDVTGRMATTIVSAAELHYGASKSTAPELEHDRVVRFLESIEVIGLNLSSARVFGDLKASLEQQGQRLADADLLIAAICLANNATLVTGNRRHFDRVPGLVLEDWIRG
ncbi:MAG: PIN domain-containing protein [Dehalococcoidia bacterium]